MSTTDGKHAQEARDMFSEWARERIGDYTDELSAETRSSGRTDPEPPSAPANAPAPMGQASDHDELKAPFLQFLESVLT